MVIDTPDPYVQPVVPSGFGQVYGSISNDGIFWVRSQDHPTFEQEYSSRPDVEGTEAQVLNTFRVSCRDIPTGVESALFSFDLRGLYLWPAMTFSVHMARVLTGEKVMAFAGLKAGGFTWLEISLLTDLQASKEPDETERT